MSVWWQGGSRSTGQVGRYASIMVTEPTEEPLTIDEVKGRARGQNLTDEDGLIFDYIRAARSRVEQDTGLALLTQTRDIVYDALPSGQQPILLPYPPLQQIVSVTATSQAGVPTVLTSGQYTVDLSSRPARFALSDAGPAWPMDLRTLQPWTVRVIVGWLTPAAIPPLLIHAVGLLASHYLTLGRDVVTGDVPHEMPYGYEDAVSAYRLILVA